MASTITIPVDPATASNFAAASPEVQRKIGELVSNQLKFERDEAKQRLSKLMDEMAAYAASQGLTEEKFAELMRDE
jgi:hypothetical protein